MSLKINNDTANGSATLQPSNTATGDVTHTLPAFTTELAPRMQLMGAKTASGTSVDFDGIPAWAKKITVMFYEVSTNGTSNLLIQIGGSGGIENTGYVSSSSTASGTVSNSISGFIITSATLSSEIFTGATIINNFNLNTFIASGTHKGDTNQMEQSAGSKTLSATLDRIRITTVNGTGTFDAGMINILVEG